MKSKKALIIIDMLNDFVLENAPLEVPSTRDIIPALKNEIKKARDKGIPIIYVADNHEEDDVEFSRMNWPVHAVKGTSGSDIIEELKPEDRDIIIKKTDYSAFFSGNLDSVLKELDVDTLIITGTVTHICVLFTAYDGVLRGYNVEVPKNCVAGQTEEDDESAFKIMREVLGVNVI